MDLVKNVDSDSVGLVWSLRLYFNQLPADVKLASL